MVYKIKKTWVADFKGRAFLYATKKEAEAAITMLQEAVKTEKEV